MGKIERRGEDEGEEDKKGKRSPICSLVNHNPHFNCIYSLTLRLSPFCDFDSGVLCDGSLSVRSRSALIGHTNMWPDDRMRSYVKQPSLHDWLGAFYDEDLNMNDPADDEFRKAAPIESCASNMNHKFQNITQLRSKYDRRTRQMIQDPGTGNKEKGFAVLIGGGTIALIPSDRV